jgi:DinB superfamily
VPSEAAELAKQARALYEPALAELEDCFDGFTDAQAMQRPEPNEWSALEVVAHLIHNERFNLTFLAGLLDNNEPVYDAGGNNVTAYSEATVKANPSIKQMLELLRKTVEEVLAFTELMPKDFASNKGSFYRFGSGLLQPNFHITGHVQQIKDALAATSK